MRYLRLFYCLLSVFPLIGNGQNTDSSAPYNRGKILYLQHCFVCHQLNGQGIPNTYPPLAQSDFLNADKKRSIRILCEGQGGIITVNGKQYEGTMPAMVLRDQEVADVLTYVHNSWGNTNGPILSEEVREVRKTTAYSTFEQLAAVSAYPPIPKAPAGLKIRELVKLPINGVRLASDGKGKSLFVLSGSGDVHRVDIASGLVKPLIVARDYLVKKVGDIGGPVMVTGMTVDKQRRLYTVINQQNNATLPVQNFVTVYRSTSFNPAGDPIDLKPWFTTNYPGNSSYLHAAEHIAFGPDGFVYISNGARTDGNEANGDTNYYQKGETEITACIWRLDPRQTPPTMEVYARGIRNAYGFTWSPKGEMFATENGPDAPAPEELNLIEKGKHYGFPYRFADWTKKAYNHTPEPPAGMEFTLPIPNMGPDGGFMGSSISSFDPHSCPGGIVWLSDDFPEPYRDTMLLTRFGNFIREPRDAGFDILQVRLKKNSTAQYESEVRSFLAPLGRPVDIHQSGKGSLYILEYSRPTTPALSYSMPGRIVEVKVATTGGAGGVPPK